MGKHEIKKPTDDSTEDLEEIFRRVGPMKPIESPIKRIRYFWKDKQGNKLTFQEFMQRWKQGLEGVTPLQQVRMQLWSTYIMLIGIVCGFVISIIAWKNIWWLAIILGGALFNTGISALGLWQKKKLLEGMENAFKDNPIDLEMLEGGTRRK